MTASVGAVTEMVQEYGSLSTTAAFHHLGSPRLEIGNVAWVLLVAEG